MGCVESTCARAYIRIYTCVYYASCVTGSHAFAKEERHVRICIYARIKNVKNARNMKKTRNARVYIIIYDNKGQYWINHATVDIITRTKQ